MFKMSTFSFDAWTKTGKSYLFFTRYISYILQERWIHLKSSDVTFFGILYTKITKTVRFSLSYEARTLSVTAFCFGGHVCHLSAVCRLLSVVCRLSVLRQISETTRDTHEISSPM